MDEQDEELSAKLQAYWDFAQTDDRVSGFLPWHWADLPSSFRPTSMTLGGSSFPRTMEAWAQIRKQLV